MRQSITYAEERRFPEDRMPLCRGYVLGKDRHLFRQLLAAATLAFMVVSPALAANPTMTICAPKQRNTPTKTCIVDGDTIWLNGQNLRMKDYDTPEPSTAICGGAAEVALAKQASARLRDLLNSNPWTVETFGEDRHGGVLATIRIQGADVGDILIAEGLARRWPNGREWWCH